MVSVYYTITTMTTVGYGDISATNELERIFAIVIMILGQVAFSYGISALGQIITHMDQSTARFEERIMILNRIYRDCCLPLSLYTRIK